MEIDGRIYKCVRASDLDRDGMYLEVSLADEVLIEVFYSDVTNKITVTCLGVGLPLELLEATLMKSRELLPPINLPKDNGNPN